MSTTEPGLCRLCTAYCPILVEIEDGRAVRVTGDPEAPLYDGYICPKGRALPEQHNGPSRLRHSMKRGADGRHRPIPSTQAIEEIAERISDLVACHGPKSVAIYSGTGGGVAFQGSKYAADAWLAGIGSPYFFHVNTIDKPGVQIAQAAHGMWQAGHPPFETAECWVLVGLNPIISKGGGMPINNPGMRLKDAAKRGMKLIVIDPRKTETARKAHIHLQVKPGEDPTILAAMLNVIIAEGLYDHEFVAAHVQGFDALRQAVAAFTPNYAAKRADVPADLLIESARLFAKAGYSGIGCGTGPSFATYGSLTEYLSLALTTVCGRWSRAGESIPSNVLLPQATPKAQAFGPFKGWDFPVRLRTRGLGASVSGLPTAALADEILQPGEGQIKALICLGGNPMMAWPNQRKAFAAMKALDLLVSIDIEMTATAELSHYVIAPRLTLETPATTHLTEVLKYFGHLRAFGVAYGRYAPKLVDPPKDSDVIEEWEFFYELARRMNIPVKLRAGYGIGPHAEAAPLVTDLDMTARPSTDELIAMLVRNSRVPLGDLKKYPHGAIFKSMQDVVQPADPGHTERLDVGNAMMLADLASVLAKDESRDVRRPFRLIPRRTNRILNSYGRKTNELAGGKTYNPAYMHPADLAELSVAPGAVVRIESQHDWIYGVVEADDSLRPGLVSMTHGFGENPGKDDDPRVSGSNTGRLLNDEVEFDPITGIPRMGAVPVSVAVVEAGAPGKL